MRNFKQSFFGLVNQNAPAIAAASFLIFSACLYVFYPENWFGRDLMSNIFAGGIDLVFTVVFLGWILRRNELRRTKPIRYAIYIDASRILAKFCGAWTEMVRASSDAPPAIGADFFDDTMCDLIANHLNVSADAGGLPPQSWWRKVQFLSIEITSGIDLIIQRYQATIDPELLGILKRIEGSPTLMCWRGYDNIRQVLEQNAPSQLDVLIFVDGFRQGDLSAFRNLHAHLKKSSIEFLSETEFSAPFDVSFVEAARVMNARNDIAPILGSARR